MSHNVEVVRFTFIIQGYLNLTLILKKGKDKGPEK